MNVTRRLAVLCVGSLFSLVGLSSTQGGAGSATSTATSPTTSQVSGSYRGLAFTTPYPATSVSLDEMTTLELTLHNYGLPPQLLKLSVA